MGKIFEYSKLQEAEAMHLCNSFLSKEKEKGKEVHMNSCSQEEPGDLQRQLKGKSMWTLQSPEDQHCRRSHIPSHRGSNTCGSVELPRQQGEKTMCFVLLPSLFPFGITWDRLSWHVSSRKTHLIHHGMCSPLLCLYLKNSFFTISLINKVRLKI